MITKTFTSWNGDKELTRDQYIQEWLDETLKFGTLFGGEFTVAKYFDFREAVEAQAGKLWDKK